MLSLKDVTESINYKKRVQIVADQKWHKMYNSHKMHAIWQDCVQKKRTKVTVEKHRMGHQNFIIEVVVIPVRFENIQNFRVCKL